MYEYRAIVKRVIDGDTIVVDLDLGRRIWVLDAKHRLQGCNSWESNTEAGKAAKANLELILPPGLAVTLRSFKPYKYGDEYMCDIVGMAGWPTLSLVDWLISDGWLAPWDGRGPAPLPPWPRGAT